MRETAPVTLTTEADATELHQMRRSLSADGGDIVPSYNDLLVKVVAAALTEQPALNASIEGDELLLHNAINIGLAVDSGTRSARPRDSRSRPSCPCWK